MTIQNTKVDQLNDQINSTKSTSNPLTFITVLEAKISVNKQFEIVDGLIDKSATQKSFYSGKAIKIPINSLDEFMDVLKEVAECENRCIILGYHPGIDENKSYYILSANEFKIRLSTGEIKSDPAHENWAIDVKTGTRVITRTKENMAPSNIMLFDKDTGGSNLAEWIKKVNYIIPLFKDAKKLIVPSNTSRVLISQDVGKWHCYVLIHDHNDIYDFGARALSKAYSLGLGIDKLSSSKTHLQRTIFDCAVFSPERVVYEGKPTIHNKDKSSRPCIKPQVFSIINPESTIILDTKQVKAVDGYGKLISKRINVVDKDGKTHTKRVKVVNSEPEFDSLFLDSPEIDIPQHYKPVTMRKIIEQDLFDKYEDSDGKVRCNIPIEFRYSESVNGILRRLSDSLYVLHDNGTGITYYLADFGAMGGDNNDY